MPPFLPLCTHSHITSLKISTVLQMVNKEQIKDLFGHRSGEPCTRRTWAMLGGCQILPWDPPYHMGKPAEFGVIGLPIARFA